MKLKIFFLSMLTAVGATVLTSCGGNTSNSEYVGKTFSQPEDIGLHQIMGALIWGNGVIGTTDSILSLNIMSTDPMDFSPENIHIFICEHSDDNSQRTILAEMDIDRTSGDAYGYEPVAFMEDGQYVNRDYFMRFDPSDLTIKELYYIDVEKMEFVPKKPTDGMRIEYGF